LNLPADTPIEPVIVPGSAMIFRPELKIRYPPEAAGNPHATTMLFLGGQLDLRSIVPTRASSRRAS